MLVSQTSSIKRTDTNVNNTFNTLIPDPNKLGYFSNDLPMALFLL